MGRFGRKRAKLKGELTVREIWLFIVEGIAFIALLAVITAWIYLAAGMIN